MPLLSANCKTLRSARLRTIKSDKLSQSATNKYEYFNRTSRAKWHRSTVTFFIPERDGVIRLAQPERALRLGDVARGTAFPFIQRAGGPRGPNSGRVHRERPGDQPFHVDS